MEIVKLDYVTRAFQGARLECKLRFYIRFFASGVNFAINSRRIVRHDSVLNVVNLKKEYYLSQVLYK